MRSRYLVFVGTIVVLGGCGATGQPASAPPLPDSPTSSVARTEPSVGAATPPSARAPASTAPASTAPGSTSEPARIETWKIEDRLEIDFTVPDSFIDDNSNHVITPRDFENGVYLLEDWWVADSPLHATFAVQRDFGPDSPVVKAAFTETIEVNGYTWGVGQTPGPHADLRLAMLRIDGYVVLISGSDDAVAAMMKTTKVTVLR